MKAPGRPRVPGALILGSDFRALGVVRSLGRRGIPTALVDNLPRSAWFSRYVRQKARWHGSMHDDGFCEFLVDFAREGELEGWVLFPMQDDCVELVSKSREVLARVFTVPTPPWWIVSRALDKRLTYATAEQAAVAHPRTWYPSAASDLAMLDLGFPIVVKPAFSIALQAATRRKAFVAGTRAELAEAFDLASRIVGADGLMLQELIPGGGATQVSVAAFCRDGQVLVAMTARRRRQYPIDFGLSSCFVEAVDIPELLEPAQRLIALMGLSGMVEVEFKRDFRDGQYKLLDVNPRAWGWHSLCAPCGVDFPYLAYREALGEPLPDCTVSYRGHRWRRLLTDLPAALAEVRRGDVSPLAYLKSFAGPTVGSVLDVRDPMPAAGDTLVAALRLVRGDLH